MSKKIIWITGASSGIGREIAIQLSKYNCTLILTARRHNQLEETKLKCGNANVQIYPFDLSKLDEIDDISSKEPLLSTYAFVIILVAISTSFFEIFYSWLRVQLASVFGNFLKEFYPRLLNFVLLTLYALDFLKFETMEIHVVLVP